MPCIVPFPGRQRPKARNGSPWGTPVPRLCLFGLTDQGRYCLKPGVPEKALHVDKDLVVSKAKFLGNPDHIVLEAEGLVIIGYGRLAALDEGSWDAASAASKHNDAHMALLAEAIQFLPGLFREFQRESAHSIHLLRVSLFEPIIPPLGNFSNPSGRPIGPYPRGGAIGRSGPSDRPGDLPCRRR